MTSEKLKAIKKTFFILLLIALFIPIVVVIHLYNFYDTKFNQCERQPNEVNVIVRLENFNEISSPQLLAIKKYPCYTKIKEIKEIGREEAYKYIGTIIYEVSLEK